MKKLILTVFIISLFLTGCKSYTIPYDTSLKDITINTGLYVDKLPTVSIKFDGLLKYAVHGRAIEDAFYAADLKDIIYDEFRKNGESISPKFKIISPNGANVSLEIPKVTNAEKLDPSKCEFDFNAELPKHFTDYILTVQVLRWGFFEGGFSTQGYVNMLAAIHDVKNKKKIWQMQVSRESSFPTFALAYSDAKNPEAVRKVLRDCVVGDLKLIAENLSAVKK